MTDASVVGGEEGSGLRSLLDRAGVIDAATRVAVLADARDWRALRTVFADEVDVDYTSLVGGEPQTMLAEALISGWRAALSGYDATQHAVTNHLASLDGDGAACSAHVVARHYLLNYRGGDFWTLGTRSDHRLVRVEGRWKIASIKSTLLWAEGNERLPELARRRFEEGLLGGTGSW